MVTKVALALEITIDKSFPQLYNSKDYGAKVRTLVYNLKRNRVSSKPKDTIIYTL